MSSAAIRLVDVTKSFGDFTALRKINIEVADGERLVVCGPSGSGKSTLVRCINQLEKHDSGRIFVGDVELTDDVDALYEVRKTVGMVFQTFNLFPHKTVIENCALAPMRVRRFSRRSAEEMAMKQLERMQIGAQAQKYPDELSGGQQQRVAIARALSMEPRIMLFDEPTSALDPEMIGEVLDCMIQLAEDGMTMICITHEMGFARKAADRVVFMADGEILESATTEDFFERPQHEKTRTFLAQVLER